MIDFSQYKKPCVMGVLNCSPNSFYQPIENIDDALRKVEVMVAADVDIIDIGGEATNPFVSIQHESPTAEQECARVLPVVDAIRRRFDVPISVDTSQPLVMEEVIKANVDMINDQRALL